MRNIFHTVLQTAALLLALWCIVVAAILAAVLITKGMGLCRY
jgi:archaellin